MADAEADLILLAAAALDAGAALRARFGGAVKSWSKGAAGPVTEADLEANEIIRSRLRPARPDYGWLSEEDPDDARRLTAERVFLVDPLDGTAAFLRGVDEFCVALAVVAQGSPVAAAVYNPLRDELFTARTGGGAFKNGAPTKTSTRGVLEGATLLGPKSFYADPRWPTPWPPIETRKVAALSYRLALVAAGEADGLLTLGFKSEWDTVAGALLVAEAGGVVSDPWGAPLVFNQPDPRGPGAVAAGRDLHPLLVERVRFTPRPKGA